MNEIEGKIQEVELPNYDARPTIEDLNEAGLNLIIKCLEFSRCKKISLKIEDVETEYENLGSWEIEIKRTK